MTGTNAKIAATSVRIWEYFDFTRTPESPRLCSGYPGALKGLLTSVNHVLMRSLGGQIDPHMQLAQLLGRGRCRCTHQQVLRLLVHREQRDLAQVFGTAQQHHDAVDTERCATMRRSAVLERPVEPAELLLDLGPRLAGELERLDHRFGLLITDRARGNFEAVAHGI